MWISPGENGEKKNIKWTREGRMKRNEWRGKCGIVIENGNAGIGEQYRLQNWVRWSENWE